MAGAPDGMNGFLTILQELHPLEHSLFKILDPNIYRHFQTSVQML